MLSIGAHKKRGTGYMTGIAKAFFLTAIVYGVLGMGLGLAMAMSQDHGQMPTHAHIMVVGWLSFAVFGLFYHLFADFVPKLAATIHFWLAQISLVGLIIGLGLLYSGRPEMEPIAAISSIAYAVSFVLFAGIAIKATR
jgi:cbb3-type cytochrome oxidase subunit 1